MTEKGALEEIFGRKSDRWTQSTSIMGVFISCTVASSQFSRPVAQFIKTHMDKGTNEWRITAMVKEFPSMKVGILWPQPSPSSSSSDSRDGRKHCYKNQRVSAAKVINHTSRTKPENLYCTSSFDRNTRTTSPGYDFPIHVVSGNTRFEKLSQPLATTTDLKLPVFQAVKRHYSRAVYYRTYRLANRFTGYEETVSSNISKMLEKV